jgi:tetraacyldisaccharide 4'-kinase
VIVVSKCPLLISEREKKEIRGRLKMGSGQELFFTGIQYMESATDGRESISLEELTHKEVLLVTGIADPKPLVEYLETRKIRFRHLEFPDHHRLTDKDHERIKSNWEQLEGTDGLVLTTEKDFVRNFEESELPVYYLPIQTVFLEKEERFIKRIQDYVRRN